MPFFKEKLRMRTGGWVLLLAAFATPLAAQPPEWKSRDAWQRPAEVMDALGARLGSVVADVGAGTGYFTFHLAARVGSGGKVYAVDIDAERLAEIRQRAERDPLSQIVIIHGDVGDPKLPREALDGILVVNAYHEMTKYDAMLQGFHRGLKPGGTLIIIDHEEAAGKPRRSYQSHHTIPPELVREDAARNHFEFVHEMPGFVTERKDRWFFLVFRKPAS